MHGLLGTMVGTGKYPIHNIPGQADDKTTQIHRMGEDIPGKGE